MGDFTLESKLLVWEGPKQNFKIAYEYSHVLLCELLGKRAWFLNKYFTYLISVPKLLIHIQKLSIFLFRKEKSVYFSLKSKGEELSFFVTIVHNLAAYYHTHCNSIPVMKTGFSLCSISNREKPVFINWEPCNENKIFPVWKYYTGKTLFWPCTGPVRDCSVSANLI